VSDLVEFLRARMDATERAIIEYRKHRELGDHVNYEGQDPKDYDEYDTCARCIATAEAVPYRDVEFGLADVAAKRQIVTYAEQIIQAGTLREGVHASREPHESETDEIVASVLQDVLRPLALPYAAHADDGDEWRRG
jgi:hypothetical protein